MNYVIPLPEKEASHTKREWFRASKTQTKYMVELVLSMGELRFVCDDMAHAAALQTRFRMGRRLGSWYGRLIKQPRMNYNVLILEAEQWKS